MFCGQRSGDIRQFLTALTIFSDYFLAGTKIILTELLVPQRSLIIADYGLSDFGELSHVGMFSATQIPN